jgi:hypothetical protein
VANAQRSFSQGEVIVSNGLRKFGMPSSPFALPCLRREASRARNLISNNIPMTFEETGIYSFEYATNSGQTAGQWEAIATVTVKGSTVKPSDWWELIGNPPQVLINSISDTTVPSITADVIITNEGQTSQEYQYEYCIVSEQSNQCGGLDDIDYASGAKLINPNEDWETKLYLSVQNEGVYWFKVKVYYGTETSSSSRQFIATIGQEPGPDDPSSGNSTGNFIYSENDPVIKIIEYPKELIIRQGEFEHYLVTIKNIGNQTLSNCSLSIENLNMGQYTIEQDKFSLLPDETMSFILKINVDLTAEPIDSNILLIVFNNPIMFFSYSIY